MNKKEFVKYIKTDFNQMPIEEQIQILSKMKDVWIPAVVADLKKNKKLCPHCHKCSPVTKFIKTSHLERSLETTHTDAGYGYDDRFGEVEYLVDNYECPVCHFKIRADKHFMRIIWEKSRN